MEAKDKQKENKGKRDFRKHKTIDEITNKQIDAFSKKFQKKAKDMKNKEKNRDDTGVEDRQPEGLSLIKTMMEKEQMLERRRPRYTTDWEEIAIEAMIKYYEQQEELGEE